MTNDKIKKALYNIDKWMPEDFELQREYYQLINDKDQKGMEEFLDMYADQDRLMRYGIQYEDLGKLSEAIISGSNYAKGGATSNLITTDLDADFTLGGDLVKIEDIAEHIKNIEEKFKIKIKPSGKSFNAATVEWKITGKKEDLLNFLSDDSYDEDEFGMGYDNLEINEFYPELFEDGGYMADGGMMDDERMTLKLQKEFKGKDLFEDEIVDEYTVKQFDSREDDDVIERWKMSKKKKFYVVPFDAQDDSFYYILVPKMKMEDGGYMAKGGKTSDLYYIELNANDPKDKDLNDVLKKYNVKMNIISFDKNNYSPFKSGEIKLTGEKNDIINVLKNPLTWDLSEDDLNEFYLEHIKKVGKYIAYIEESRRPGGSDKSIKKTYNLDVEDRTSDGFYVIGAKEDIEDFINDYSINFAEIMLMVNDEDYARGGKTKSNPAKFRDKVKAISKKLAGTKVPKKYKKDYGATYDKKEANTAAKRIAGAKLAEVRAKLAKKKK
jgi:acyl carrier protein